jgi:hypothetical protein
MQQRFANALVDKPLFESYHPTRSSGAVGQAFEPGVIAVSVGLKA